MPDYLHPSQAKTLESVLMRNNIDHVLSIRGVLFVDGPNYAAVINEAGMIEPIERLRSVAEVELPLGEHASQRAIEEHERWSNKLWQPPIEVVYRAILDPLTKEEVGLAYGRNPLHTDAWSYGPEEHMTYSEFDRFVWPVLDDMERHNYGDHHFALVFR